MFLDRIYTCPTWIAGLLDEALLLLAPAAAAAVASIGPGTSDPSERRM